MHFPSVSAAWLLRRDTWKWNVSEPVAGNYYPLATGAALPGGWPRGGAGLSVAVDRAQARRGAGACRRRTPSPACASIRFSLRSSSSSRLLHPAFMPG